MVKKTKTNTKKLSKKEIKELEKKYENSKNFDLIENKIIDETGATDEVAPESIKVKKISPFEVINMMFTNQYAFDNLTDSVLQQSAFVINRTFSIKYPLQAQFFNLNGVNTAGIVKAWQKFITKKEGTGAVPKFVYTGGAAKQKKEKTKADQLDKNTIKEYCSFYHLTLKDFNDMLYFYNEETIADVEEFERKRSKSEQSKMFTSKEIKQRKEKE